MSDKDIYEGGIRRLYGLYRATVVDNRDPLNQRRLKLRIQTSPDSDTAWISPMYATIGTYDVPVIGQGVWVQFQSGDPEYPVWFGWFGKNQAKNKQIFIKPLANSVVLTGLTSHIIVNKQPDGTSEIDLTETIMALANKIKVLEGKVTTLESKVATLESKAHTHP
jgi:hypothetical protein